MPEKNKPITDAELALLSLLAEQPMHGYQIEQTIEGRGMREWTQIGFSSIYYVLEKMKKKAWLTSELSQGSGQGPARQVFKLTSKGREIWKISVLDALSNPHRTFSNFYLGLANLLFIEKDEVLASVKQYQQQLQERKEKLNRKVNGYNPSLPWEVEIMFDYGLAQIECELQWVEKFIGELSKHKGS